MTPRSVVIGTRGSTLALKQAEIVSNELKRADPSVSVVIKVIQTEGDINQNPIPLSSVGKGWFTKEIEDSLISGTIDLAVHSLKDLAEDMPEGLHIGAYLARADARDVLVTKNGGGLAELSKGAVIGTDSTRRQVQMLALRPFVRMKSIRGNVPTRLQKLQTEEYDAVILALAGLRRLELEDNITHVFDPLTEMTPAPGQGILAVQARTGDTKTEGLLISMNDEITSKIARIERSFSKEMGGGCKSPTGAHATFLNNKYFLTGMAVRSDGTIIRDSLEAPNDSWEKLGEVLAKKLKKLI